MALTLRNIVNRPLTNQEVDDNFTFLETSVSSNIETIDKDSLIAKRHLNIECDNGGANAYNDVALSNNTLAVSFPNSSGGRVEVYYLNKDGNVDGSFDIEITSNSHAEFGRKIELLNNWLVVTHEEETVPAGQTAGTPGLPKGGAFIYDLASPNPTVAKFELRENVNEISGETDGAVFAEFIAIRDDAVFVTATSPQRLKAYRLHIDNIGLDAANPSTVVLSPEWAFDAPTDLSSGFHDDSFAKGGIAVDNDYVYVGLDETGLVGSPQIGYLPININDGTQQGTQLVYLGLDPASDMPITMLLESAGPIVVTNKYTVIVDERKVWVFSKYHNTNPLYYHFDVEVAAGSGRDVSAEINDHYLFVVKDNVVDIYDLLTKKLVTTVELNRSWSTLSDQLAVNDNWFAVLDNDIDGVKTMRIHELKQSLGGRVNKIEAQSKINSVIKSKEFTNKGYVILDQNAESVLISEDGSTDILIKHWDESTKTFELGLVYNGSSGGLNTLTKLTPISASADNYFFGGSTSTKFAGPYIVTSENWATDHSDSRILIRNVDQSGGRRYLGADETQSGSDARDFGKEIKTYYRHDPNQTLVEYPNTIHNNDEIFLIAAKAGNPNYSNGLLRIYTLPIEYSSQDEIGSPVADGTGSGPKPAAAGFILDGGSNTRYSFGVNFDFTSDGKRIAVQGEGGVRGTVYLHSIEKSDSTYFSSGNSDPVATFNTETDADFTITPVAGTRFTGMTIQDGYIILEKRISANASGNTAPSLVIIDDSTLEIEQELSVPDFEFGDASIIGGWEVGFDLDNAVIDSNRLFVTVSRVSESELNVHKNYGDYGVLCIYDTNTWKLIRTVNINSSDKLQFVSRNVLLTGDQSSNDTLTHYQIHTKNDVLDLTAVDSANVFDGAFSSLTGTPTTIAGYGITDAFDGAFSSLSGTPTTLSGYGITDAATPSDITTAISNLVDSAPGTLDTLNELAAALGDDPNFATTVTNSIAAKISNVVEDTTPQLGGTLNTLGNDIVFGNNDVAVFQAGGIDRGSITADANNNFVILAINDADLNLANGWGNINLDVEPLNPNIYVSINGIKYPKSDGTNGQVLTTDGSGSLTFTTPAAAGISNLVEDTTPQLGGDLDLNGKSIKDDSRDYFTIEDSDIKIFPSATGYTSTGAGYFGTPTLYLDIAKPVRWQIGNRDFWIAAGGALELSAGSPSLLTADTEQDLHLYGGSAFANGTKGGNVVIDGGGRNGTAPGGDVLITAGGTYGPSPAGDVVIKGGSPNSTSSNGAGGDVIINGGGASINDPAGNVVIEGQKFPKSIGTANQVLAVTDVANNQLGWVNETLTSLAIASNTLTYTDEAGNSTNIDLSLYLDDTNLARLTSGSIDGAGLATFTRDDASTFTVDFSALFDDTNLSRINSASFNTSNGELTLTRDDSGTAATVDLDGRYLTSYAETDTLDTVTDRGNTTTNDITVGAVTATTVSTSFSIRGSGSVTIAPGATADLLTYDSSIYVAGEFLLNLQQYGGYFAVEKMIVNAAGTTGDVTSYAQIGDPGFGPTEMPGFVTTAKVGGACTVKYTNDHTTDIIVKFAYELV